MNGSKNLNNGLPKIKANNRELRDISSNAMAALKRANTPPVYFVRSGKLVRFRVDEKDKPMIEFINDYMLIGRLARVADFYTINKNGKKVLCAPPLKIAKDILALGEWNFPALVRLVECPILRPDGSILSMKGYDPETGLYYYPKPGLEVGEIPANPTSEQIDEAKNLLLEVIHGFPLVDEASQANMVGLLITPIVRPAINGYVPLAQINAPQAGTGKTMLSQIVGVIATGHSPTMMLYSKDSAEMRKKITSVLLADSNVNVLDNVTIELNSEILSSMLTSPLWGDRLLGKNEMLSLPHRATWIANGNNIRLGGDLPRRCYLIQLDAEMSRPWQRRGFLHPDLVEWVEANRGHLLWAVMVLARAWVTAGRPIGSSPILGGFTQWSKVVGGILYIAGINGFLTNLEVMYDTADEEGLQWESFLIALRDHFGDSWFTTAEVCDALKLYTSLNDALPDEFESPYNYMGEIDLRFKRNLGTELKKRQGTRFGMNQIYIDRGKDSHRKIAKWRVICGEAGSRGSSITHGQIPVNIRDVNKEEDNPANPAIPA